MAEKHFLSKTSFLKSVQCARAFFLYKNHYNLKDPLPKEKQLVFNRGHKVGMLAQQLFPGGVDVTPGSIFKFSEAVDRTQQLISDGQNIIYEAAFIYNGVLIALDILVKEDEKWYAYEVKSSLKVTQAYVMDAALQYYVLKNCLPLEDFFLVNMDEKYVLEDKLDVQKLFKKRSVKADAEKNLDFIEYHVNEAKNIHSKNELPPALIGERCYTPYQCDFYGLCWKGISKDNVFDFSGISRAQAGQWIQKGISHLHDIPDEEVNGRTAVMLQSFKKNEEIVNREKISAFFDRLKYPIAFFDAEMFAPAVPAFKGTSPFEAVPFLFSWHVMKHKYAEPEHYTYFHERNDFPAARLLDDFLSLAQKVNQVLVFDTGQELKVLANCVRHLPEYKPEVDRVKNKFIDFSTLFNELHYYHPKTKGSMSLKKIYESVFEKDAYAERTINSGLLASYSYGDYLSETDIFKKEELKNELIAYCKTDTEAMYKLFGYLQKIILT